ncbi:hypothetical protein [Xenorhabdus stockiae]|uniref:hypothetical protein n=1 Tax=Xenorhabdus stockiae TaxID=351614 RepID=UPI0040627FF5
MAIELKVTNISYKTGDDDIAVVFEIIAPGTGSAAFLRTIGIPYDDSLSFGEVEARAAALLKEYLVILSREV